MSNTSTAGLSAHSAFIPIRRETIESLNVSVEQYEHRATGASHYHIAADNAENVFLVALRTVPQDSSGVAHILEHTALCGSERFPVRDPFFMMLRRSLNTFMNAFTSSDWTAYPFASQNRKDFNNLLDVYLDAVFFSRLDPLDFSQEGHRVEFAEPDNADSDLVYKGVVFNEMKGAMSSVGSTLWAALSKNLFPTTTYHYNSGGDPADIPDLSYEQLKAFYKSHYHPTNAIFMTFGDIPAAEHQSVFEEKALKRFEKLEERIQVPLEHRYDAPIRVADTYAFDDAGSADNKTHIVIGWLLGESTSLDQLLEAQLLSSVLIDNSSSPLMHALETTELGQSPSPLCGLEDSMRELVFCCGVEGSESDNEQALEQLVLGVLEDVAEKGVLLEELEAVLHQLELHQREITGDSFPYGLQLILSALGCATHYADPIPVLNLDPVIASMREKIQDPDYIRGLARRLLLDNSHRVTLVMTPDKTLSTKRTEIEADRLAKRKAKMDETEKNAVIKLAADLVTRQSQVDDETILPKVELSDIPASTPELQAEERIVDARKLTAYGQGTNGLVYQQAIASLPKLQSQQMAILPLYSSMLTELGLGETSYLEAQRRQASTVGAINAFTSMRGTVEDEQSVSGHFIISSKALLKNSADQSALMRDTLENVRFDETTRIKELISQQRARREQGVTGNGHGLAMAAASAGLSPLAKLNHELSGLVGIRAIRELDDSLRDDQALASFAENLGNIHAQVTGMPMQLLTVAEGHKVNDVAKESLRVWAGFGGSTQSSEFDLSPSRERVGELWATNTQVNFCAQAYPTVPVGHADAAALTILGGFLRNGFLHRAIREQGGAYGGGASQDSGIGAFRFYSYRDPRLEETLNDFDAAIDWLLNTTHSYQPLEEAILGVISSLDKPSSPAGEAKQHFHNSLFGRTHAQREKFRQNILSVTLEDLTRVTQTYLKPELASTAVITGSNQVEATAELRERRNLSLQEL
ncbi:MAG: Zn-dependent M16 (insulinase) family peptidase [Halioglobus sp.]|jgi:Zn-dependent M16 (insulinase) family peptidase